MRPETTEQYPITVGNDALVVPCSNATPQINYMQRRLWLPYVRELSPKVTEGSIHVLKQNPIPCHYVTSHLDKGDKDFAEDICLSIVRNDALLPPLSKGGGAKRRRVLFHVFKQNSIPCHYVTSPLNKGDKDFAESICVSIVCNDAPLPPFCRERRPSFRLRRPLPPLCRGRCPHRPVGGGTKCRRVLFMSSTKTNPLSLRDIPFK